MKILVSLFKKTAKHVVKHHIVLEKWGKWYEWNRSQKITLFACVLILNKHFSLFVFQFDTSFGKLILPKAVVELFEWLDLFCSRCGFCFCSGEVDEGFFCFKSDSNYRWRNMYYSWLIGTSYLTRPEGDRRWDRMWPVLVSTGSCESDPPPRLRPQREWCLSWAKNLGEKREQAQQIWEKIMQKTNLQVQPFCYY